MAMIPMVAHVRWMGRWMLAMSVLTVATVLSVKRKTRSADHIARAWVDR